MKKSFILTHQKDKKDKQQKNIQKKQGMKRTGLSLKSRAPITSKSITNEIDNLVQRINQSNQNIKSTQKLLDIDLFLKVQKQKRLEYAKQLNTQYQASKKVRQEKLYKKYNRNQQSEEVVPKIRKSEIPLQILKIFDVSKQTKSIKGILLGHNFTIDSPEINIPLESLKQSENLIKQQLNTWKRIQQVVNNSLEMSVFPIKLPSLQLIPSEDGQNLMNAIMLINPNSQFSNFHYQYNSPYVICKIYDYGVKKTVVTTSSIQVRQFDHKCINTGSRIHNGNYFGFTLIEKCYRILKMPYQDTNKLQNITLQQSIYDIHGLDPEIIQINKTNVIKENFAKVLYSLLMDQCRIGFYNQNIQNDIYNNRIYPLIEVRNTTVKPKTTKFQFKINNPWKGKLLTSNNQNIISLEEILNKFDRLVILRPFPSSWYGFRINVSFFSNGPISNLNNQWAKNSQYLFTITKIININILLRKVRNQEKNNQSNQKIYGFMLFYNKDSSTHISCMKIDNLITKVTSAEINGASYSTILEKGDYIIVPFSNQISNKQYKFFYLDFHIQRQDSIVLSKAKLSDFYFQNTEQDGKVTQKLQIRQRFEKPKITELLNPPKFQNKQKNINSKVTMNFLEQLALTILKDVKLQHFFIPGKMFSLLINSETEKQVKIQQKPKSNQNQQLKQCEREQNLNIILGYDAMNEDINKGKMKQILQQRDDQIDLSYFQLGEQGLNAIICTILQQPIIRKLNLTKNCLNDEAIVYLCYYLEKLSRLDLRQLNLSQNPEIGKIGISALKGLIERLPNIKIIGIKNWVDNQHNK